MKFLVTIKITCEQTIEVEADDEHEAVEEAHNQFNFNESEIIDSDATATAQDALNMIQMIGTYQVPVWAIPVLMNGDCSGVSESEGEAVDNFENELLREHQGLVYNPVGESYFSTSNDIDDQGGDVQDVEIAGIFVSPF